MRIELSTPLAAIVIGLLAGLLAFSLACGSGDDDDDDDDSAPADDDTAPPDISAQCEEQYSRLIGAESGCVQQINTAEQIQSLCAEMESMYGQGSCAQGVIDEMLACYSAIDCSDTEAAAEEFVTCSELEEQLSAC